MSEKLCALDTSLEIWRIPISDLREQDVNARQQDAAMFERLTTTVKRDGRLESLPFVAQTDKGFEIVSGHHRVRAAIAAMLPNVVCLVDSSGLNSDQIKAKQLAHNSIQGKDNAQLVSQIFKEIQDADAKLEAFIDQKVDVPLPKVKVEDITIKLDYRFVSVVFLPSESKRWDEIVKQVGAMQPELWAAEMQHFAPFQALVKRISADYDMHAMGTILSKMGELASLQLGNEHPEWERVAIRDIFKSAYIPKEAASVVKQAVARLQETGAITEANTWQALEYLAAEYLAGNVSA